MGRWFVAVSLLTGLLGQSGCGDNDSSPGAWTSGYRYRADVYRSGDAAVLRGWYDAYLDLDCTSQQLSQPSGCPRVGHVFYADAACTRPWVDDEDLPSPASYYQGVGGYYKVTNFEREVHEQFFRDGTGACRDGHASSRGYSAQVVDASTFVTRELEDGVMFGVPYTALESDDGSREVISVAHGILVNAESHGRLQVREYQNGGVRAIAQPEPLFDRQLEGSCHPARAPDGSYRCAMTSASDGPPRLLTHDPTCQSGLVPAAYDLGFVLDETPSPVDGVPELAAEQYHCPHPEPGEWYEQVDTTTCAPVGRQRIVYPCTAYGMDVFAVLTVDRE